MRGARALIQGKAGANGLPTLPAMRRLLSICLMLLLPWQGLAWAISLADAPPVPCAAAWVQTPTDKLSQTTTADTAPTGAAAVAEAPPCCDADCGNCHEQGLVALICVPVLQGDSGGSELRARSAVGGPDHIPELPQRPPPTHAA